MLSNLAFRFFTVFCNKDERMLGNVINFFLPFELSAKISLHIYIHYH